MNQCKLENAENIITEIKNFLFDTELDINPENIEEYVKAEIPNIGDFSLNTYALDPGFKESLKEALNDAGFELSDVITDKTSKQVQTKSNVAPRFESTSIVDMFHTMPLVKALFENYVNGKVITASYIGGAESDHFVNSDDELNEYLADFKEELFETIQKFLISKNEISGKVQKLYGENGEVLDYGHYSYVMKKLNSHFFNSNKYSKIKTYSGKDIPNLDLDKTNGNVLDAYNAGIILNNFDSVLISYFKNIINIDYRYFNNLQSTSKDPKYKVKIKGIGTEYWLADTQEAEGSESAESDIIKLLVSTIPIKNKNGFSGMYSEMKDFYLLAAKISDFEVLYGNQLKNQEGSTFKYFNEDPKNGLMFYLDSIVNATKNKSEVDKKFYTHFYDSFDFINSLREYLISPELNIQKKEENSLSGIIDIFSQIINNNFGTTYSKYNADGKYTLQEMYKQNFNNITVQNMLFSKMFSNSHKAELYSEKETQSKINELLNGISDDESFSMKDISKSQKSKIGGYIGSKTGIFLSANAVDELIDNLIEFNNFKVLNKNIFKNLFTGFMTKLSADFALMSVNIKNGTLSKKYERGDVGVSANVANSIADTFFKAINAAYLVNYVVKPVMTVEDSNGNKLPSFKVATLTHKDTELFEEQRLFERKNQGKTLFRSKLIQDAVILGTGTKLEAINGDNSKKADNFNVSESFISDFQFDFLENLLLNNKFNILLGNYSDKSTILTKIINGEYGEGSPLITQNINQILELVRTQAADYYKDTINKIINDYSQLLDLKLTKDIEKSILAINKALKTKNVRDLSKKASDLKINLTEELHFSKYKDGISLNQNIVDNYRIFNNSVLFNEFVKRQESQMLDSFRKYNKNIGGERITFTNGNERIPLYLKKLNLNDKDFGLTSKPKSLEAYTELQLSDGLTNPLLRKWMWMNALMRNEYLFISAKGEYMHKNKELSELSNSSPEFDENHWKNYETESSLRLKSMGKRNVVYTATIEVPVRKSPLGVSETVNMAVIEDSVDKLYNILGQEHKQDVFDGASFINYIYSKMVDNSYPSKGYQGTKKQFATFITENGVTIKKDAESVITNDKIRNSLNSKINLFAKQKQMLGLPIGELNYSLMYTFNNEFFYNKLGENFKINSLIIKNNSYKMLTSKKVGDSWIIQKDFIKREFNSLYDLWELFGGAYSTDENGNFNEGSNDLLYSLVTKEDKDGNYPLKDKIIHIISNLSAVKAGATNVNSSDLWTKDSDLAYYTFNNRFMGPQLDASHHADESKIKEVTQVISALSQNASTAHIAQEAYQDIANVIKKAMAPYENHMKSNIEGDKDKLYKYLSEKFVKTIAMSKGDNIAKILVHSFSKDMNIPFSNQNFYAPFVKEIITKMNNEFITRYYSGTGAILIPSHGIVQLYDVPIKVEGVTTGYRIATQADLAKEALKPENIILDESIKTNQDLINNYINNLLKDEPTTWDKIQLGDTIRLESSVSQTLSKKSIKEIDLTFDNNTNLSKIGTKEEYSQYLATIFPDSKVKDVLYHVTFNDFNKFELGHKNIRGESTNTQGFHFIDRKGLPYYLMFDEILGEKFYKYGDKLLQVAVNFKNPKIVKHSSVFEYLSKDSLEKLQREGYDSILMEVDDGTYESIAFDPEQIHILGSNQDIEGFKEFVKNFKKTITLSTPQLYYTYKLNNSGAVYKVLNKPRDLKPTTYSFIVDGKTQNAFDLTSVRLKYLLEKKYTSEKDLNILQQFANYFELKIEDTEALGQYLNEWTQRNLSLMDDNLIMGDLEDLNEDGTFKFKDAEGNIDFKKYFGEDNLIFDNYNDTKEYYFQNNSKVISNYKFESGESIMGDIYKSKFNRDFNDSMNEIENQGYSYFANKIIEDFEDDDTEADIKLNVNGLDHPVYIKYVKDLQGFTQDIPFVIEREEDEDQKIESRYIRLNDLGEPTYSIPNPQNTRVILHDGKEMILIKDRSKTLDKELNSLLSSFKGNIKSFIPLMNNKDLESNAITLSKFSNYSGYTVKDVPYATQNWYRENKYNIAKRLGKRMFASWEKSQNFVAARIPSQSMQSFMPMKNVAYHNTLSNDVYVSVHQLWYQGSDLDIDKAYMLGYGYDSKGQFEDWSNISDYSTSAQLDALAELPIPNGRSVKLNEFGIDLSNEFQVYITELNTPDLKELSVGQIRAINSALRKINKSSNDFIFINSQDKSVNRFIKLLNNHNKNKFYARKDNSVKNSIVTKISEIIKKPSNQLLANTPVDVDTWRKAVNVIRKRREEQTGVKATEEIISPYTMFGYYKQQRDAAVGKSDVGIAANGLKVMFALSSYYNDYYANSFETTVDDLRKSFKTFKKEFTFNDFGGNTKVYRPAVIADVNISKDQRDLLTVSIGDYNLYRKKSALALSAFTSLATDNAKELLMAKVNASVELASMHVYLMILGFTEEQIVEIMTSEVVEDIVDKLETNVFFAKSPPKLATIFADLRKSDKYNLAGSEEVKQKKFKGTQNLNTIESIYQGAQEIKLLASILGANQKTSANTEELTRFLTQFETLVYARENSIFGKTLKNFSEWEENRYSPNTTLQKQAESKFEGIITKIFENNNQLNYELDKIHVIDLLNKASEIEINYTDEFGDTQKKEVSLLGGKFDYRYYMDERNKDYRKIAKEYYNLIKNTVNIFDVIDNVPHFKEMINGITLSYNMLNNTSKMFNFIQNQVRDVTRRNTNRIVFSDNDVNKSIKNQMGNEALQILIDDTAVNKAKLGAYIRLKSLWLKSESTSHLSFNVNAILKKVNESLSEKSKITNFAVYTSDDAREMDLATLKYKSSYIKYVNETDDKDTIITLDTNYGVANFKRLMEEVLLPLLVSKDETLARTLAVKSIYNLFGLNGTAIVSTFPLDGINNPVNLNRAQKLLAAYNNLDTNIETKNFVLNDSNQILKWRDLFYVYNLVVNNDMFGANRLTPLFQDYFKEKDTLGYDYVTFTGKWDSREVVLFDPKSDLEGLTEEEKVKKINEDRIKMDNDILFYTFNKAGKLSVRTDGAKVRELSIANPDFVVITDLTETESQKTKSKELSDIMRLIKKRGFIIKFEC